MNWSKLIQELVSQGLTQTQIADYCQTGQSHISSLLKGTRKSPSWQLGESLRELHGLTENLDLAQQENESEKAA